MPDTARRDWLRLARTERVGPFAFDHLIRRFGDAGAVLDAMPELARKAGGAAPKVPSLAEIERELEMGERVGARLLVGSDPDFPRLLAVIDPPPPLIWTLGDAGLLARPAVAIVGARVASAAGQRFAETLARALAQAGHVVVSGMARGIDRSAHLGSLAGGTVAVLGGGVDDVYPRENADLYQQLCADGCVVSESPVGYRAQARDFPRRNRLISGLSRGVIVVEAEMRSGSLITARLAGEQGREVFAVPGSPLDPRAAGCNDLIRQGATLCAGVDDVLRVLESMPRIEEPVSRYDPSDPDPALVDKVFALLTAAPIPRDDLIRLTGAPASAVNAALVELSLAGRASLLSGGMVSLG